MNLVDELTVDICKKAVALEEKYGIIYKGGDFDILMSESYWDEFIFSLRDNLILDTSKSILESEEFMGCKIYKVILAGFDYKIMRNI